MTAISTFSILRNQNLDALSDLLEGSYEDVFQHIRYKNDNNSFLTNDQVDKDRDNFNKIKAYYRSCMDEDTINTLGPTPMYSEIEKLLSAPSFNTTDTFFTSDNLRYLTETLIHLDEQGTDNLISYGIGADDHAPDENVITFGQPSLGLPSREYYEQPEIMKHYRNGLVQLVTVVLGEPIGDSPLDNLRRQKLREINFTPLQFTDVEAMVDRFIEFETNLAKMTVPK